MRISKQRLIAVANEFRRAFDNADLSCAPGFLPQFPQGCCLWASLFIANFLKYEYGLFPRHAASEGHPVYGSGHEWVVVNEMIIDITVDQFRDAPAAIIVAEESKWHDEWQKLTVKDFLSISDYDKKMSGRILHK